MESIKNIATKKIAVIGGGVSSLSFLYSIKATDKVSIDLFERSLALLGRVSTRKTEGFIYDNGANYLSTSNQRVLNTILNELNTDELITIKKWVYGFDKNNVINYDLKEAESHNKMVKYNYKSGFNKLGNLLFEKIKKEDINFNFSFDVEKLTKDEQGWEIHSKGSKSGYYDYIIFGTPAFNVAKVFKKSDFKIKEEEEFFKNYAANKLSEVKHKKIYSLSIAFEANDSLENLNNLNFYALINSDREHPVSWISVENEKEGRVPEGKKNSLCLIVQMSEDFSEKYALIDKSAVTGKIVEEIQKLLPNLINTNILFSNLKLWGLALPKNSIENSLLEQLKEKNLFIIGDSILGKGRVDGAMLTGFELYDYISQKLI
jgi:renalase